MAIQIGGTTVINNSRNIQNVGIVTVGSGTSSIIMNSNTGIVNVGSGITIDAKNGNISISGILTVSQFSFPITATSFSPAIGSTSAPVGSNILITFNQTVGLGTTGFFQIKTGLNTTGGTLIQNISPGAGSTIVNVTDGGRILTIDPSSAFELNSPFYVTMSRGFVISGSSSYAGINTVGTSQTYYFTTRAVPDLGDLYLGGFLICKASPVRWLVSPRSAEVTRSFGSATDANTTAQSVSGCTGWFVPSVGQLQNPGYCCRSFWGPSPCYSTSSYWSSTSTVHSHRGCGAYIVNFSTGGGEYARKEGSACVRAFRCVTY
jgi:hypothetical protein